MSENNDELEQECEEAVFKICCTRERYSVRCANQLEKYLTLITNKQTAPISSVPAPNFKIPTPNEEQEKLFRHFETSATSTENVNQQPNSKNEARLIFNRIKELKSILNQIERSASNEMHQLLKE